MNETIIRDFKTELSRFNPSDELRKKQLIADRHLSEFRDRFPLERFSTLRFEEFRAPYKNRDDFCSWITTRTSDLVFGRLPWGPNRLGAAGCFSSGEVATDEESYEELVHRPLIAFLESRGDEKREAVHRAVGYPLMLKLLVLYYPESFINIVKVSTINQVCDAFGLMRRDSIIDQSSDVKKFCSRCLCDQNSVGMLSLVKILDDFVGLRVWASEAFCAYLLNDVGFGTASCMRIDRHLRTLSNRLQEGRFLPCQLIKINDINVIRELCKRNSMASEEKGALEWYIKFLTCSGNGAERNASGSDLFNRLSRSITPYDLSVNLQTNARERKFLRHYTTLSSLLYILDGGSVRLTRGDDVNMNDQLEWQRLGDSPLWKRTFITCLSGSIEENAAMWAIYGKPSNEAVRLSFSHDAIELWMKALQATKNIVAELDEAHGKSQIEIAFDQVEIVLGDVLYGGSLTKKKSDVGSYTYRGKRLSKRNFRITPQDIEHAPEMTGLIKSADWIYEDETRLIARIREGAVFLGISDLDAIKYIYLPIPRDVLTQVEVMSGPCIPEKLMPVLKDLVEQAGMAVTESVYYGNLKFK